MSVFSLYQLFEAQSFRDLPVLLRDIVGDDEERKDQVTERFLDLNDKDRWVFLQDVMATCIDRALYQERAFYHVFFQQGVHGHDIDDTWEEMIVEDCENNETFKVNFATQTDAVNVSDEVQIVTIPTTNDQKPKKTLKTRYTSSYTTHNCSVCNLNLASDGSLYNHYESTRHRKCLREKVQAIRSKAQLGDKIFVDFRTGANAPELTWECETQKDIDDTLLDTEKYLNDEKKSKANPIVRLSLTRHGIITGADGKQRKSNNWSDVTC